MAASVPQIPKVVVFTLTDASGTPSSATSFKEDAVGIQIVNEAGDVQSILTLDGVTHQDASASTWFLEIEAVIDWDTSRPGLAYYLFNNEGDTASFVFGWNTATVSATNPQITGSCVLVPLPYGGTGNEFATATVRLPITGAITVDITP